MAWLESLYKPKQGRNKTWIYNISREIFQTGAEVIGVEQVRLKREEALRPIGVD